MPARMDIGIAVIRDNTGRILVARRPEDAAHLSGLWEFPGGKPLPGESLHDCIVREAGEELGVLLAVDSALPPIEFDYPERRVRLHPFTCRVVGGEPAPLACAEIRWVAPEALSTLQWPDANRPLVDMLGVAQSASDVA